MKEKLKKVEAAWSAYGDLALLEQSALLEEPLCRVFAWSNRDPFAVRAMLRWQLKELTIDRRKRVRNYAEALQRHFVDGESVEAYTSYLASLPPKEQVSTRRGAEKRIEKAVKFAAKALAGWLDSADIRPGGYPTLVRYELLTAPEQLSIQYLALFQKPESRTFLCEITSPPVASTFSKLLNVGLLIETGNQVIIHPQARDWIYKQTSAENFRKWHTKIAKLYEEDEPLTAVYHFQQAGNWVQAAKVLTSKRQQLGQGSSLDAWEKRVEDMRLETLSEENRAQIFLLKGQIAALRSEMSVARNAYEQALNQIGQAEGDLYLEARYRLAHLAQEKDPHRAIGIVEKLLKSSDDKSNHWRQLSVLLLAWLRIEQQQNFAEGRRLLEEEVGTLSTPKECFQFHNTWAEYHRRNLAERDCGQYQHHAHSAYDESLRGTDLTEQLKAQYNVALAYMHCDEFELAKMQLERNYAAAENENINSLIIQNRNMLGSWLINAQKDFAGAAPVYERILVQLREMDSQRSMIATLGNLTYAYAELGNMEKARPYYQEGSRLADELEHQGLIGNFAYYAENYPELIHDINANQVRALRYVREHGEIANRDYRTITGLKNKAAAAQLMALVNLGLLRRVGRGSSVRYVLNR